MTGRGGNGGGAAESGRENCSQRAVRARPYDSPPGSYVTPNSIGLPLVRRVLDHWVGRNPDRVPRVLDPGCGPGAFLLWTSRTLKERYGAGVAAAGNAGGPLLTGIDIDPAAVETCRRVLDGENVRGESPGCRVFRCDFLAEGPLPDGEDGFDIIVGNPPWVSLKGKHGKQCFDGAAVGRLVERYGASRYRPNLAELFIHRSWELLRPGGLLAFVIPDRIGANLQFENLRRRLLVEGTILELEFGLRMPGIVSDVMTCVIRRETCGPGHTVRWRTGGRELRRPQRDLLDRPWKNWTPPHEAGGTGWIAGSVPLGGLFRTSVGFIARAGTIAETRTDPEQRRVVRGRDIVPYRRRGSAWFRFERQNLAGGTQDIRKLAAAPKILVRKTGDRVTAALDESGDYPEQSLYFLHETKREVSWEVLLAWLNSDILDEYVKAELLTNRNSIAQLKKVHLDRIPVPEVLLGGEGFAGWSRRVAELVGKRARLQGKDPDSAAGIDGDLNRLFVLRLGVARRSE